MAARYSEAMREYDQRELVNRLTHIARTFGRTQQLRDRIAEAVDDALKLDAELRPDHLGGKIDWGAVDHELQIVLRSNNIALGTGTLRDDLRGLLRKVSGQ